MAATTPESGKASELAASVGLTDDDLIGMYRVIATARAVDERMWVLNRAGRIPFVISGQGHEGAQAAIAWPLERKKDWIARGAGYWKNRADMLDSAQYQRAMRDDRRSCEDL